MLQIYRAKSEDNRLATFPPARSLLLTRMIIHHRSCIIRISKAWSSGPVRLNRTTESVSVLVPKVRLSKVEQRSSAQVPCFHTGRTTNG